MSESSCRLFKRCGGCQLRESYAEQLAWKQAKAERLLSKFAKCEPIIGMKKPYNYRNKVQHGFYTNPRRQIISGIFQSGSGKIVPCESCMLEDQQADKIISTIRILMRSFKLFPYNPQTDKGLIRHVMVRKGHHSGEYLVCIITCKSAFPSKKNFVGALLKAHPYITTIVQNVCQNPMPLTMGEQEFVLHGKGYIEDTLCGKKFRISARSFYQVNPVQTEILYRTAMEFAGLSRTDRVLDCYCGTGTIGIIASDYCGEVIGVELNSSAAADAVKNAAQNGCTNMQFVNEDSGRFMEQMVKFGETADVVFTDPPRTGSDKRFLESLARLAPRKVVYISCGIESLERDLLLLQKLGYTVQKIQPVDMFPHTKHVECVVLLSRQIHVHNMKLHSSPFERIKRGNKTIELRLFDKKRQQIKAGDKIVFTNTTTGERLNTTVVKLHRFDSFEELYQSLPLLQCGYTTEDVDNAHPSDMEQYYSVEEQKKYGVVGIELCRS